MLEEKVFIKNIYYAMERLRKKGEVKYEDNIVELCEREFYAGRKVDTNILYLAVQTNMMQSRNQCLTEKQSNYHKIYQIRLFFREADIKQLIEFHAKKQLEELTHFALTLSTTFLSCKEKYLIKKNQSNKETVNYLAGKISCQNISKQKLEYPDFFTIKAQCLNVFSQLTRRRI